MEKKDKYLVLTADIEGSKQLDDSDRKIVQEKLRQGLDELNEQDRAITSQYSITMGDEFQAVLSSADYLFDDVWHIMAGLHPVMVRFSVGIGSIATSIEREQVLGMDGPAFHVAREGIDTLKKGESLFRITMENEDTPELRVINNSLHLLSKEIRSWNSNRVALMHLIRTGIDYKEISKSLGISEQSFYKNKDAGSLDLVNALFEGIQDYINNQLNR
ncbi:MAG: SatD family protein [Balneolaceae bacterium]|nr:SatD family protein [Balneolaceae bacterium]